MQGIIRYFIQNPVVVNLFLIIIVLIGVISFSQIRSTSEPLAKERNIRISTNYRGASPEEVENGIVNKIEENLKATQGIRKVTSNSSEGHANIDILIKENSDINIVLQDVKDAVGKINTFPEGMEEPIVSKAEMLNRTFSFAVNGDVSLYELKDYAKKIKDDLLEFEGISTVKISGLPEEEIEITISQSKLEEYNLTVKEISSAIQDANIELTGGTLKTSQENISIRARSKNYFAQDLENIIIRATSDGGFIYLSDVTSIKNRFADVAAERYLNGKPSVTLQILSRNEENFLVNSDFANQYITEFNKNNSLVQCVVIDDSSIFLREVLGDMAQNGIIGFSLVLVVLALFLQRKLAFWVALKIPVAFLGMLILGSFYDLTFNMVSIFGFILVLGILVDDGIVIGENIYLHHTLYKKKPLRAALDGAGQMVTPVFISLLTTSVAFMLFFFLSGHVGDIFSEMAFVVIGTLVFALIESFLLLPAHIAHSLAKPIKASKFELFFNEGLIKIRNKFYLPLFKLATGKYKWATISFFTGLFIFTLYLVQSNAVKIAFFPNLDDTSLIANLELKPGTNKEVTYNMLKDIEEKVKTLNDELTKKTNSTERLIQKTELKLGPLGNEGQLNIILLDNDKRDVTSFEITKELQKHIGEIPEAINFTIGGLKGNTLFGKPVSISLYGKDIDELRRAKEDLKASLKNHPELRDVIDNDKAGNTELMVELKPLAYHLGLSHNNVMQQIRHLYFGFNLQNLQRSDEEIKVWLRFEEKDRKTIEELEDMNIIAPNGNKYLLKDIATFDFEEGVLKINHNKGKIEIKIEAELADMNVSAPQVLQELEETVLPEFLSKYPNIAYEIGGQNEETSDLINEIKVVGPIILLIIVALMIFNGKSFSQAGAILLTFPFVLIGVILGHFIHGALLNLFSMLGMIALFGVFVNDALVFTSSLNDNLREGMKYKDALLETAKTRFRPIVLTSITTVAGLAPTLFSNSMGTMMIKPPAISISYGLLFGLLLPLFFLPVMLIITNWVKRFWARVTTGQKKTAEEVEAVVKQLKNIIQ